jgi:molybdopterin/thiamine biosynthesis adenylyltransferase
MKERTETAVNAWKNICLIKLKTMISICGAGALGANITETLARSGIGPLTVVDRDRIEERNLRTQPYGRSDVGAFKARILSHMLYRAVGAEVRGECEELTERNVHALLGTARLVVDVFDNSASRQLVYDWCVQHAVPCLHAGLAEGYAEVMWNEEYVVPSDGGMDFCDEPPARTLVLLAASVACECIAGYLADGTQRAFTITQSDLCVQEHSRETTSR